MALASSSPMNSSLAGSHFSFRPSRMAKVHMWQQFNTRWWLKMSEAFAPPTLDVRWMYAHLRRLNQTVSLRYDVEETELSRLALETDWVITPDGPRLLEGNTGWAMAIPQMLLGGFLHRASLNTET